MALHTDSRCPTERKTLLPFLLGKCPLQIRRDLVAKNAQLPLFEEEAPKGWAEFVEAIVKSPRLLQGMGSNTLLRCRAYGAENVWAYENSTPFLGSPKRYLKAHHGALFGLKKPDERAI